MKKIVLDTNILISFLTDRNLAQQGKGRGNLFSGRRITNQDSL
jgi:predicted nucleic acid-binding protein